MIKLVLADDQPVIREGLAIVLAAQDDIEVVAEAADGAEAVASARRWDADVVVMDIRMPRVDGIEATRRLVSSGGRPRVLVLTTFGEDRLVYDALRAGASGYLLKDATRAELVQAVRAVAAGEQVLSPTITRNVIGHFVRARPPGAGGVRQLNALTPREVEVARLVAEGLTNAELAQRLTLSVATIKTHVAHILAKLGLRDRIQLVVLAYASGLIDPATGDSAATT